MAQLIVQSLVPGGLLPNFDAAEVGGDSFLNSEGVMLFVKNEDGSIHTITIVPVDDPLGVPQLGVRGLSDIVIPVAATTGKAYFSVPDAYVSSGGLVNMTYDAVGLSIAVLKTGR